MTGVDKEIALHKLHVDPSFKPVKQKKRNFSDDKNRAIQKEVEELIRKNMEIYIDDMLVKSKKRSDHLGNLGELLERLRKCRLHINPEKYSFGATSIKFLGFMISERGIEPN
ncbi:hypothetical protein LIER_07434 [Lithospermum erythrorhizon]|uniref:Reverse transcriptase domain-containing protein n=1 Tax=Lithospermum erythrorhizon TaxID=34254 RepID=A0AAV3PCC7_LITER